jgi:hypothetical protein
VYGLFNLILRIQKFKNDNIMAKKFIWKVWLVLNRLTKDVKNDYIAEVSTTGKTLRNEDTAREIKDEGSELQYETILDILNHGDRLRRKRIQQGYSVQTGVCHITPRVPGNWLGTAAPYDPEKHKITCDFTSTDELRKALEEVGVEVLGVKDSGARIGLVTDVSAGKTDGTITPNGDITIDGVKIKIDPADGEGLGIFFVDAGGSETPVTHPLSLNNPKKIICRVPALGAGEYTLKIVTQFSTSMILLKKPRTIVYELPLTVE